MRCNKCSRFVKYPFAIIVSADGEIRWGLTVDCTKCGKIRLDETDTDYDELKRIYKFTF